MIATMDSFKEVELTRGVDIVNVVDKALAKFKGLYEFVALLKKDHDTGFDIGVETIFYNIWAHYRDLDYMFLGGELTYLIREWLEEERLNAPDVVPPFAPPSLLTGNAAMIETVPANASE